MNKDNWPEIQAFYDDGNSFRDIVKKFGFKMRDLTTASKMGYLKARDRSAANKIERIKNPRNHTEETKKKLSSIRRKYLEENPDKVPYRLYHYSKYEPYSEKYFKEVFEKENVDLKFHLDVSIYELDFYNEEIKLCVEIDGSQHYVDKRIIQSDIRRTEYLEKLGWKVFRIRWSDFKRKPITEKIEVIQYLKNLISVMKESQKN
jgi:very-short-patch-repair endonuclease